MRSRCSILVSVNDELVRLTQLWPVSTIDGEPSLTRGTLTVASESGGGVLLVVSCGDESFPDNLEVQFPLSSTQSALVARALGGEHIGELHEST